MKKNIIIFVSLLFLLFLMGCIAENGESGEGEEIITLRYAFFAPANTFPAKQMEKWKEELEKRTDNRVKVELFPGGTLLDANNMYDGVKNRVVDIGLSCPTYEPGRFPLLAISDLPSGFPNAKVASQVIFELVQEFDIKAFEDFKIITVFATEPSRLMTTSPVRNLEDLRGKQIRISGALTSVLQELGAAPVGMPMSEVPEAVQTGVIDGLVTSREVLMDLQLAESLKYTTDYPLTVTSFVAVMNMDVWNSIPKDIQNVIDDLSLEMAIWTGEYMDNHVEEALEWSKQEHGLENITLSAEEAKTWTNIIQPLQDNYVEELEAQGLPAKEYQARLYELINEYTSQL